MEKSKKKMLLRVAGARDGRIYIGPQTVSFHVANRCNLRCRYCWSHSPSDPRRLNSGKILSFDRFAEIVRDCRNLGVDSVVFTGDGEPTMHPRFADMMKLVSEQPFQITVLSNGTFPKALCRVVLKASAVHINLGAVDRRGYEALHGKDLFLRVTENIRALAALRDAEKPEFRIYIVFVINKLNAAIQGSMVKFAKRLGADALTPVTMSLTNYTGDILPEKKVLKEMACKKGKTLMPCFNGWFVASIEANGSVGFCCKVNKMNIANVNKKSFRDIWESKEFMRMRLAGRRGELDKMFKECSQCSYRQDNINIARMIMALNKE